MIKALDAACRQRVVIDRDHDTCIRCSRRNGEWDEEIQAHTQIQWCHVHTREYYVTRWEDDNSFAGCSRCHVFFDNHKVISYEWFRKTFPERWEHLQNILQSRTKAGDLFIRTLYEELKADPPGVTLPISEDFGKEAF
jgi:hypothetical protein